MMKDRDSQQKKSESQMVYEDTYSKERKKEKIGISKVRFIPQIKKNSFLKCCTCTGVVSLKRIELHKET